MPARPDCFESRAQTALRSFTTHILAIYEVFEREKLWFRGAFVWRYVVLDDLAKSAVNHRELSVEPGERPENLRRKDSASNPV